MEEKQRRFMSSNEGTSFGAGAGAGLSAPASDSASTRTIVREETVTPEEYRAIERVSFSSFFPR